ncbi:MAG TPA: hypothetical protein VGN14_12305 [Candidatus Elarobacter sp.]
MPRSSSTPKTNVARKTLPILAIFAPPPPWHHPAVMENTSKIGTTLAAAVLALGLPTVAAAQDNSTGLEDWQVDTTQADQGSADLSGATTIDQAMADSATSAQQLNDMGQISAADIAVVSMGDMNLDADQRYTLAQNADPSTALAVQSALSNATVAEYNGTTPTLADHLQSLGIEPASVVALTVGSDGMVTVFTQ